MMDIFAILISLIALGLSLVQFFMESKRAKEKDTLDAYSELQNNSLIILSGYPTPMPEIKKGSEDWKKITDCLASLEKYAVGVNTGIYSLTITNRLGGSFLIHQYAQLRKIIDQKRDEDITKGRHYNEFEELVNHLQKCR